MSYGHINYYAVFFIATFLAAIPIGNSYAETEQKFTTIQGKDLENNSFADMILKNIEIANQRIEAMQDAERERIEHQKFIEEQRRIAQAELEKDLASMNKKYKDFTPRNAFASFVSGFNSTHHGIYWDQFDYLDAKVQQANKAKNSVLANGGSYTDAMKQYVKHASISRAEMIKTVSVLNIKHGFSDEDISSHFDENGKLPRYENDNYTPKCFGCEKYEKIKQQILEKSKSVTPTEKTPDITKIDNQMEIQKLQSKLENLKKEFLDEDDLKRQKQLINSMNQIVERLQALQEKDKTL
ncbi:MAG TPA: hypothetical protein VFG25_03710 [Nitrosopumilaceae archaeon]|nr:hypothetical protein [Nitrosopumilaceae archaeon]